MPLHPQVRAVLDLVEQADAAPYWTLSPTEARAQYDARAAILDAPGVAVHAVDERRIVGPAGDITLRLYWPRAPGDTALPAVLWTHGGGHVLGSLDAHDAICRRLCRGSAALVVSVDYRLAPEHPFPGAVEDSFAALTWLAANAGALGADGARLAVAGDSAGGNLAAVNALLARDAGIVLRAQGLIYPATAPDAESPSHHANASGYLLTRELVHWFQGSYRRDEADREDFRYAPLIAPDHRGVAPALVLVAEYDPLRDEGIAYAQALMNAGNEVRLSHYAGMVHAFFSLSGAVQAGHRAMAELCAFLEEHLRP